MPSERTRKAMSRIVGIDLGTTNSLVGYVDETTGLPRVIPDAEGRVLLPSVVSFTREGVLVGEAAKRLLVRRPATTIYSVKRLMGRGYEDIKEELCYLPFKVVPCDGIVKIQVEDREVTPPQVSAIVLKSLKERAEQHLGGDDFDRAIVVWLLDDIRSKHGVYLGRDSEAMQELRLAAEAAKIRPSVDERAALTIPFDGFTYHREIARTELEELIGKLVDSRSEEHTSELQSRLHLVCRLLLEKKKNTITHALRSRK